jgi:hypothetical protein
MKLQIALSLSMLLIFFYVQCMELVPRYNNYPALPLNNAGIEKLTDLINKKKLNLSRANQRTKRLNLFQQLLNNNATIIFSNNDDNLKFWINKKDETTATTIFYEKCFFLLNYKHNTNANILNMTYTPFNGPQKNFNLIIQCGTSRFCITVANPLPYNTCTTIMHLIDAYSNKNRTSYINIFFPSTPPQPDQFPLLKKETTDTEKPLIKSRKKINSPLDELPWVTQQILRDILSD